MKILTSNLMPPALNWLVAKLQGIEFTDEAQPYAHELMHFNYCTDWSLGGWIIEREGISIYQDESEDLPEVKWSADSPDAYRWGGPTHLIAAMRCYVASKLGAVVEVPHELYKEES